MKFCPKCGGILIEKDKEAKCSSCNYKSKEKIIIESTEKIEKKTNVGVVNEKDIDVFPITNAMCPKCKNKEAYFWTSQTRAGDEAETKFFKCTKCKNTWREYR